MQNLESLLSISSSSPRQLLGNLLNDVLSTCHKFTGTFTKAPTNIALCHLTSCLIRYLLPGFFTAKEIGSSRLRYPSLKLLELIYQTTSKERMSSFGNLEHFDLSLLKHKFSSLPQRTV